MNQYKLKTKLLTSFGILLIFIFSSAVVGYLSLDGVTTTLNHVIEVNFSKERLINEFRMDQKDIVVAFTALNNSGVSSETMNEQEKIIRDADEKFSAAFSKFQTFSLTPPEKEILDQVQTNWKPLVSLVKQTLERSKNGSEKDSIPQYTVNSNKFNTLRANVRKPVEDLREYQKADSVKWDEQAKSIALRAKWTLIISALVGLLLGLTLAIYFTNYLVQLLREIAHRLTAGSGEVAEASRRISASSDELAGHVNEQSSALQETSSAMEEISAMLSKTANNASSSADLAVESHKVVQKGQQLVQSMLEAIGEIDKNNVEITGRIEESNRELQEIVAVIADIGNKTQVINDIVFQTKLLSFNASVEAARAGEAGKGFAVVAEEVGNLAKMSGNAAGEISVLLQSSSAKVEAIVNNTKARVATLVETSKEKMSVGTEVATQCDQTFQEIVIKSEEMDKLVKEIASASHEQSLGVGEVSKAISQLEEVTHKNSATSKTAAAEATKLAGQANELALVVAQLNTTVEGS